MAKLTLNDITSGYGSAALYNANNTLIEAALENTLSRDGTSPNTMSANIDMNSNKIVNLAAPTASNDAVRLIDLQEIEALEEGALPSQTGNGGKYLTTDGSVTAWQALNSATIAFTPAGNISAVTMQNAIVELDNEKVGIAGNETVTGNKTFSGTSTFTGSLTHSLADNGAAIGPSFILDRNSSSPAASDILGGVLFKGRDDAGNTETYGTIQAEIVDPANGSEDSKLTFKTLVAGSATTIATLEKGLVVGSGTDGGAGTISVGTAYYLGTTLGAHHYIKLSDTKAANTAGGDFTSGAWRTRTLTTEDTDTGNHCSLASNQFTLAAGTYEIEAYAPAYNVQAHKIRLRNTSDSTTPIEGTAAYAGKDSGGGGQDQTVSMLHGRFTIASSKTFEIQHQCQTTQATNGFGNPANMDSEVYTVVILRRVG